MCFEGAKGHDKTKRQDAKRWKDTVEEEELCLETEYMRQKCSRTAEMLAKTWE